MVLWSYELPPERIAQYPVEPRHAARLLIYRQGQLQETVFLHLSEYLPPETLLFYNDSRVVPARLRQGRVEFFLTEIMEGSWHAGSPQRWKGLFRPGRFWRRGGQVGWEKAERRLLLRWIGPADEQQGFFAAEWSPASLSALEVVETFGEVPLPPYIKRPSETQDKTRYQTFYAREPGSVAAPTAGLHFTPEVWQRLHAKGIQTQPVTLHVGLGTFLPLRTPELPEAHPMHAETFSVTAEALQLLQQPGSRPILCVGTTTLRLLESLYWIGALRLRGEPTPTLPALVWKQLRPLPPLAEALQALEPFSGSTSLYILPGYPFQVAHALVTNFHQPQSTLLGLVEAFIGRAGLEQVYQYALEKGFRFLSYGDASLLWRV